MEPRTSSLARDRVLTCERGAGAVEYALIASLIAVVIVAAVRLFGANLATLFSTIADAFGRLVS